MKFEVYKDRGGDWRWRWRLKARNGKIIADSGESYYSRWNAERGIARIQFNDRQLMRAVTVLVKK